MGQDNLTDPVKATLMARARDLAEKHMQVAVCLTAAAAGHPKRLIDAPWRGSLDAPVENLAHSFQRWGQ